VPTLDDVYRKFGETSEMAQLLETELGNQLFIIEAVDAGLLDESNPQYAADLLDTINSHTLGKLLTRLKAKSKSPDVLARLTVELWWRSWPSPATTFGTPPGEPAG
jgi:hypothetical protein